METKPTIFYISTSRIFQSDTYEQSEWGSDYYQTWKNYETKIKHPHRYAHIKKTYCFFSFKEVILKNIEDINEKIEKSQKNTARLQIALEKCKGKMPF